MAHSGHHSLPFMLKTILLTSLVLTVPIVLLRSLGGFEGAELAAYDDFMRRRSVEKVDDRVVIVTISDNDIEQLQQYPIHDGTFAEMLEKLESYQPRAIGMDISRDVPQGLPAGRKRLTETISNSEAVVSGCLLSRETYPGSPPAPGTPEGGAAFADLVTDADKTVRRVLLVSTPAKSTKKARTQHVCNDAMPENEVSSLSFQLALMYLAGENINPEPNANGEVQLRQQVLKRLNPQFGSYAHADVNDYQMMLNYRGANQVFREVPILDVLQDKVDPKSIRDRVVLIGSTSEVSKDVFSTPYIETQLGSRTMFGVVVHAHAVSQILSAVLNQRPLISSWSEAAEILWIVAWSLGSGMIAFYNRRLGLFILVLLGTGVTLFGICYGLFTYQGLWIPFVPTLTAAILTAIGVRLVDLASRSGYAQAVYEQLLDQVRGNVSGGSYQGNYLESLVQRARAVRQGEHARALLTLDNEPDTSANPEMKALYERIAMKVKQDVAAAQATQQAAVASSRRGSSKINRIQSLLNRAQRSRTESPTAQTIHPSNHTATKQLEDDHD